MFARGMGGGGSDCTRNFQALIAGTQRDFCSIYLPFTTLFWRAHLAFFLVKIPSFVYRRNHMCIYYVAVTAVVKVIVTARLTLRS
jgi:hypothetical protein